MILFFFKISVLYVIAVNPIVSVSGNVSNEYILRYSTFSKVCFTNRLKDHPVCLTTEGAISVEMQKVINALPNNQTIQAKTLLEINENHPIAQKLKELFNSDKEELKKYTKVLYAQAKLIEGLNIDNPTEISNLICEMIAK